MRCFSKRPKTLFYNFTMRQYSFVFLANLYNAADAMQCDVNLISLWRKVQSSGHICISSTKYPEEIIMIMNNMRITTSIFIFCESLPPKYQSLQVQAKNTELRPLNLNFWPPKWSELCVLAWTCKLWHFGGCKSQKIKYSGCNSQKC